MENNTRFEAVAGTIMGILMLAFVVTLAVKLW